MFSILKPHRGKLALLMVAANMGLLAFLAFGDIKYVSEWKWLDIIGEGGSALLALIWLFLVFKSRPAGRVTNYLSVGLSCVFFSWWIDALDEFIRLPKDIGWDHWLESGPMPVGLILLTIGIYHWHREQLAISAQMEKRERGFREHRLFDKLTPLGSADYLKRQLVISLEQSQRNQQPLSLVAVDIDNFSAINQAFGHAEGDEVLSALSHLLVLNLRRQDLLCRLAGDRFVVLLPNTGESQAKLFAQELQQAVAGLAHKTRQQGERLHLSASTAAVMAMDETPENLLKRLNFSLARVRQPLPRIV
ncbi:GGDEF domain-containing protein [Pseudomonas capsici]|uniref:diguanylate cyclase n=1 Tax=Pseudomonas capsici TaxID=2810614 RepID=A0ABT3BQE0_9PSED|nr:GGDEF domain-containing protein [Pseudomonas capsici]MCV4267211.1 GGDEF domain-containing protein [Pseudomonas capsici]MCV4276165.1 GGDEF domain-containing protein [Pseudomonas capsici]MCV4330104.1 GGDEF domain-containing protein [Pseudomonas capsici]MCV4375045.1 GGDEF domain-containing protein [Pseudomonas capsici]